MKTRLMNTRLNKEIQRDAGMEGDAEEMSDRDAVSGGLRGLKVWD